jgi:Zn-dependent protease with chaperone function
MLAVHGLYGHVRRNNARSLLLFAGFLMAFVAASGATILGLMPFLRPRWLPWTLTHLHLLGLMLAGLGALLFVILLRLQAQRVRSETGYLPLQRSDDPRLFNLVENLAISTGLPNPTIGVIETPVLNAFATGWSPRSSAIVVTSGLLRALDDEELEAVLAHEIAHIRNGDVRLMLAAQAMRLLVDASNKISLFGRLRWWHVPLFLLLPPLLLIGLFLRWVARAATHGARNAQRTLSKSRELIADAQATEITKNPGALISALEKLRGKSQFDSLDASLQAMMIDGLSVGEDATHPTIDERVGVLVRHTLHAIELGQTRRDTRQYARFPSTAGGEQIVFGRRKSNEGVALLRATVERHTVAEMRLPLPQRLIANPLLRFAATFAIGVLGFAFILG